MQSLFNGGAQTSYVRPEISPVAHYWLGLNRKTTLTKPFQKLKSLSELQRLSGSVSKETYDFAAILLLALISSIFSLRDIEITLTIND